MQIQIDAKIRGRIQSALREDLGKEGDLTSLWTIPKAAKGRGEVVAKAAGVISGGQIFEKSFYYLDKFTEVQIEVPDGDRVKSGQTVATVAGSLRSILSSERVALNFLCHLSGIATLTRKFVDIVEPLGVEILDTRKTLPLWRTVEKYAVRCGGGRNHRIGLYDMVLIKDNHIAAAGGLKQAIEAAKKARKKREIKIEVEVVSVEQASVAAELGVDIIMLDNMTPTECRDAVGVIAGEAEIEISGGINLENVHDYAETGIDFISIGSLTHSAGALDLSLNVVNEG